jgi:hypothetical protein
MRQLVSWNQISLYYSRSLPMKHLLLILIPFGLLSCNEKSNESELYIKSNFCLRMMDENDDFVEELSGGLIKSDRPEPKRALEVLKEIISWRLNYSTRPTIQNLLIYSDSIVNRFKKSAYINDAVVLEIEQNREGAVASDSLAELNLLYWTLIAENGLHSAMAYEHMGFSDGFSVAIPSYINNVIYSPGDTVLIAVGGNVLKSDTSYTFRFEHVRCINLGTDEVIYPKVTAIDAITVLSYFPKNSGNYSVHGEVEIWRSDLRGSLTLDEKFSVK